MNFDFTWDDLSKNLQANATTTYKKFEADKRFWKLSKNEDGNGAAVIRLLPDADNKPFVKLFHYGMKKFVPGSPKPIWFIANSPESIGAPCPVKEHYMALKAEGTDEALKEAEKFKRQTKFYANIMVIKDPANPDNDGKVFLWEFGTKMKDRIVAWLNPSQEELDMGETPKALYNPVDGFSIKLKIQKQGDFFTYDGSSLMPSTTSLFDDKESAVEFIKKNTYALSEFLQPEYYDEYQVLKDRLNKYLGGSVSTASAPAVASVANKAPEISDDFGLGDSPAPTSSSATLGADDDDSWLNEL